MSMRSPTSDARLLAGRTAIVTGGASGIGQATVLRFAAHGAAVVAADLNAVSGETLLDIAEKHGVADRVRFVECDISVEQAVSDLADSAVAETGRLDVMFNNAGVGGAFGHLCDVTGDDWDYTFAVNCRGVFLGVKHAARVMRSTGRGGSIINTASIAALSGDSGPMAYSAAKAAVVNLTQSSAVSLAADAIRVNCICPGSIMTPLLGRDHGTEFATGLLDRAQPWPHLGRPEHVANVALFLASELSEFVTGTSIVIDGGASAAGPRINRLLAPLMSAPPGASGVARGSTGQSPTIRRR